MKRILLFSLFFTVMGIWVNAQTPNDQQLCPFVDAGPDVNTCGGQQVTLTATFADIRQPTTYAVGNTPYNPFSLTTGTNILVDLDDIWSGVINMGFNFCYWGNNYNQLVVGSNGLASFNTAYANTYCTWPIGNAWPSNVGTVLNTIGSPWHDIDPSVGYNPDRLKIHVDGTAPCRKFIVTFNQIPMFSGACNSQLATHQIIMYETSNVIDVHIGNKPLCATWNSGRAIQGIQNANGTQAVVVPGRNHPTQWTAANDGKRFYPTGAPAYTIQWLQGATVIGNTATINVNPSVTTTYTVRITYTNCNGTQTIVTDNVTVNVSPINPPVIPPQDICGGQNATLNAGPGFTSYQWTGGLSGQSITVSPAATTTYTVTVTDGAGCTASSNVTVSVGNNIVPPTIPPANICGGETTSLNAGAGFSNYVWSTGQTGQTITVSPGGTTSYTVTVTNASGCTAESSVTVTVNAVAPPAIPPSSVCAGQSTTLDAGPGFSSYAWSTGSSTQTTFVNPAAPTTYTVTVTGAGGCTASASVQVGINTISPPALVAPPPVCSGQGSATLNAGPGFTNYEWSTGQTGQSISVSPTTGTTYTVTVTNAQGCTAVSSVSVPVNAPQTPSISGSTTFCVGGNTTLTASGGFNIYNWSNGQSTQSITVTTGGTYTVNVVDANGCTGSASTTVTVSSTLNPVITGNLAPCLGSNTTLDVGAGFSQINWSTGANTQTIDVGIGSYTVTVTSANGCTGTATTTVNSSPLPVPSVPSPDICTGQTLSLSATAGFTSYNWSNGALGQTISISSPGIYTVTVTDSNGCTGTGTGTVTLNNISIPPLSAQSTCAGGTITFTAPPGFSTYAWSNGASGQSISVSPPSTTTYTLTVTDANGCTATTNATLNIVPPPVATTDGNVNICIGDVVLLGASGGVTYQWDNGAGSGNIVAVNPAATTTYTVTVTDAGGCSATAQSTVFVNPLPTPTITPPFAVCIGAPPQAITVSGGTNYTWNPASGNVSSVVVSPTATTTYSVTVTNSFGCTATIQTAITVNPLPTPAISGPLAICNGESATLTASGGVSYQWDNGQSGNSITVNPTFSTTYTVTATDANGCSATQTYTLAVNGIPQAIAANNGPVCTSQFVQLLGDVNVPGGIPPGSTVTYNWSGPGGFTSNDQIPIVSAQDAQAGIYTLIVNVNGCESAPATTNVVLLQAPNATAANNGPSCGAPIQLSATSDQPGATYQWFGPGIDASNVNQQSFTLDGDPDNAGEYTVVVTVGNCPSLPASTDVVITPPPAVSISGPPFCQGQVGTLTASNGFTSYAWASGETTQSIVILSGGTYQVTATDAAGCVANTSITVNPNPVPVPAITGNATLCAGQSTTLSASAPGLTYSWSTGVTTPSITVTPNGSTTYSVTVTSTQGCTAETSVDVIVNPLPVPDITGPDQICVGNQATLTVSGGNTYQWSNGLGTGTSVTVSPATTTTYTVTATSAQGCTATTNHPLTVSTQLNPNISGPTTVCAGNSIDLNAGTYAAYNWGGGQTTQTITVSPTTNTTYTVTVTDASGCTGSATRNITVFPQSFVFITASAACGGSGTLSATGGFASYLWTGNLNTPSIPVNTAGTYSVTITDFNGCTATNSFDFTPQPNPILAVVSTTNATCGNANGSATLSGSGGTGTLNYTWSQAGLPNSPSATGLAAGSYTVTVTDANGCTDTETFTINNLAGPSITSMTPNNATCGNSNGSINVAATGGTTPLSYAWSHSAAVTGPNATALPPANYTITVTDANACTATQTVTINNIAGPTLTLGAVNDAACGLADGSATVNVSGGTAPINYTWSQAGLPNSASVTGLAAGSYTVTATDANGCQAVLPLAVANLGAPTVTVGTVVNATCGFNNGSITVSATGGTGVLDYDWSHDSGLNAGTANNLFPGNYFVTVTDENNCVDVESVVITNTAGPTLNVTNIDAANCGGPNGSITVTPTGGTAPFNYAWSQAGAPNSPTLSGIVPGTYTVTITDANSCQATAVALVNPTPNPTLTVTAENPASCGQNNGSGTVSASGGVGPYSYSWSQDNGLNANAASGLATGAYTVTVTDSNGCSATTTVNIPATNGAVLLLDGTTNATCGLNNGSIAISATGGNGALVYQWSHNFSLNSTNPTGLGAGAYSVTATDATGCQTVLDMTVSADPVPTVSVTGVNPTTCGQNNGSILVTGSGGVGALTYTWSPALPNTPNPTGLASGTYSVTVTDANGCEATETATVNASPAPSATATPVATTCGLDNGSINLTVSGITGPSYNWSPAISGNPQNPANLASGTYNVTITGTDGCSATASATVSVSPAPTATATPAATTCGLDNGSVSLVFSGITTPTFSWSNGASTQDLTNVAPGTYTVTVSGGGCSVTANAIVVSSTLPSVSTTPAATTCGANNGSITVTSTGITSPTYTWSPAIPGNPQNPTGLASGTYTVTVSGGGCTATQTATIAASASPVLAVGTINPASCGQTDGSASVTVSSGIAPYNYSWSQDNGLNSPNAPDLGVGSYTVTVTDAAGCTDDLTLNVTTLNGPQLALVSTSPALCGNNTGSVTFSSSGGTGALSYEWSHDSSLNSLTAIDLAAGTYTITVTDDNGCTNVLSATVDAFGSPTASLATTLADCTVNDGTATATVTGGTSPFSYAWSFAGAPNSPNATGLAPGDYTVTVTDDNGCTATATATVTGNIPPPVPDCGLVTNATLEFVWTAVPNAAGYEISINGGAPQTLPADTTAYTVSGLAQGETVTVTLSTIGSAGCGNSTTVTQSCTTQSCPALTPEISGLAATYCIDAASVTLSGTPAGGVFSGTGISGNSFDPAVAGVGSHTITYTYTTDGGLCIYTGTAPVTVVDLPVAAFTSPATICLGEQATFQFTGTTGAGSTYSWNFGNAGTQTGAGPHNVSWNSPGNYTASLTVTSADGCTAQVSEPIGVSNVSVTATTGTGFVNSGQSAQLTAVANSALNGTLTYAWTVTGGAISCTDCPNPLVTPVDDETTYTILATDEFGCSAQASVNVGLIYQKAVLIPNAFSPNGDGENDVFRLSGINVESVNLYIYDRWGGQKFIMTGETIDKGWDGTFKGKDAEIGVYVYYAEVTYTDGTTEFFKGNVTLIK